MMRFAFTRRNVAALGLLSCFCLLFSAPSQAQNLITTENFVGRLDLSTTPPTFVFTGAAAEIGRFGGIGEMTLRAGDQPGTKAGSGIAVLLGRNGDLLVGNMTCEMRAASGRQPGSSRIQFHWSDSVTFSNGCVVKNTGRFVTRRPSGLVVLTPLQEIILAIIFGTPRR